MARRLGLVFVLLALMCPTPVLANSPAQPDTHNAEQHKDDHHSLHDVHPLALFPFVGLLVSIAVLPLVAGHFWHSNRNRAMVAGGFSAPIILYLLYLQLGQGQPGLLHLGEALHEYLSFIILLGSLYTVSGGIVLDVNMRPHPFINCAMLGIGAVLANLIGTTGASMLLIRPFLRINKPRPVTGHLPIFFIFMVSNLGGLLTPLGDPPLFLGFLRGVSFFWTLQLWPQWLVTNGLVLGVFFVWDWYTYSKEPPHIDKPTSNDGIRIQFRGWINVLFLAGIVGAVLLKSALTPGTFLAMFGSEAVMVLMAVLSLRFTPKRNREANLFGWGAILEVAVLFIGIFITMVPALAILQQYGNSLGINHPAQYFWMTGMLSGFLDNAPTYVTFATLKAGQRDLTPLMTDNGGIFLAAISCGAVFMGALTYIGNGPNFMVKAISDEAGYRTPSFFGYLAYSLVILGPILVLITLLFFLSG